MRVGGLKPKAQNTKQNWSKMTISTFKCMIFVMYNFVYQAFQRQIHKISSSKMYPKPGT